MFLIVYITSSQSPLDSVMGEPDSSAFGEKKYRLLGNVNASQNKLSGIPAT